MHPPQLLFAHVRTHCNLPCQHCGFWKTSDPGMGGCIHGQRMVERLKRHYLDD